MKTKNMTTLKLAKSIGRSPLRLAFLLAPLALALFALSPTAWANPGDIYVSDNDAIHQYTPTGTPTVFATSLNAPRGLTFDNVGNLFASIAGDGTVVKFAPDGTQSTVASNLGFAAGLAFDGVGNLYVSDAYGALYKIAPGGAVGTVFRADDYGTLQTHQFFGVAIDKGNNVYLADSVQQAVYQFTPKGKQSIFASNIQAIGLTFDSTGNLLVTTSYEDGDGSNGAGIPGGGKIIKIPPSGKQTVVASGLGDLDLRGIAIDSFGNIFAADHAFGNHGNPSTFNYDPIYSNVLKVSNGVASIFASELNVPQFVAIQPATPVSVTINFDAINASGSFVGGATLKTYLQQYGVSINKVTAPSQVVVDDDRRVYGGGVVFASSPHNFLSDYGLNAPNSFTLNFDKALDSVSFTRIAGGPYPTQYASWTATALNASGAVVSSVSEGSPGYANFPAKTFTLNGPRIVSVRFDSNGHGTAAFSAVLLDDLVLN